jgi:hypothetical protein
VMDRHLGSPGAAESQGAERDRREQAVAVS